MLTATGGDSVIDAVPVWLPSPVAVMVKVCCVVMLAGAVYSPVALIVPAPEEGLSVQVTVVLPLFATVAVSCSV